MLARVLLAVALAAAPLSAAPAAAADVRPAAADVRPATAEALEQWTPAGGPWTALDPESLAADTLLGCATGEQRRFVDAEGAEAGILWLEGCGDAATANAALNQHWDGGGLYPASG